MKSISALFAVVFAVTLLFVSSSEANSQQTQNCKGKLCDIYQKAKYYAPQPTKVALVCIHGVQFGKDNVVVQFKDTDAPDAKVFYQFGSTQGQTWRFCFGRQFFEKAASIVICNGDNKAPLSRADIKYLLDNKENPKGRPICLLGEDVCNRGLARR